MYKTTISLSKEGVPYIAFSSFATLILAILSFKMPTILALVVTFFIMHFFRDPERVIPREYGVIVAPADGKVFTVETALEPITGVNKTRISIFMNIFDVHVNRSPVNGNIDRIVYKKGQFSNALRDSSSVNNERNIICIKDENEKIWTIVQVAGILARRIVCWGEEQDQVLRGQRIGLIKFGSRVDLYLPEGYDIMVSKGEKVFAGQSTMAKISENQHT